MQTGLADYFSKLLLAYLRLCCLYNSFSKYNKVVWCTMRFIHVPHTINFPGGRLSILLIVTGALCRTFKNGTYESHAKMQAMPYFSYLFSIAVCVYYPLTSVTTGVIENLQMSAIDFTLMHKSSSY